MHRSSTPLPTRKPLRARMTRVIAATIGLVLTCPALAAAADTIHAVSWNADPLEERGIIFSADLETNESRIFQLHWRPAGGIACGATRAIESAQAAGTVISSSTSAAGRRVLTDTHVWSEPGTYQLCGYLQEDYSDTASLSRYVGAITVRGNSATIMMGILEPVTFGNPIRIGVTGVTELTRILIVDMREAGGLPCQPSYSIDVQHAIGGLGSLNVTGAISEIFSSGPINTSEAGKTYLMCAYVQEDYGDDAAEAIASLTVSVPDLTAPTITSVTVTRQFRRTGSPTQGILTSRAAIRRGGTIRYTLSEPALTTIQVQRRSLQRIRVKRGSRTVCVRNTARARRESRRDYRRRQPRTCYTYRSRLTFKHAGVRGPNTIGFTGQVGSKRLTRATYRLALRAVDTFGNRSKTRYSRTFRIPS